MFPALQTILDAARRIFRPGASPSEESKAPRDRSPYPKLKKHLNGRYHIRWNRNHSKSLRTRDEREARRLFEKELRRAETAKAERALRTEFCPLSEFTKEYLAVRMERVLRGELAEGTLKNDEKALRALLSVVGDISLRQVTPRTIETFRQHMLAPAGNGKRPRRESYIDTLLRHLRPAFEHAYHELLIDYNPVTPDMFHSLRRRTT